MNDEELMAASLAGEKFGDELNKRCLENPQLLQELSDHVVVDRLLRCDAGFEESVFIGELEAQLSFQEDETFVDTVRSKIDEKRKSKNAAITRLVPLALAASVLVALWIGFQPFAKDPIPVLGEGVGKVVSIVAWDWDEALPRELQLGEYELLAGAARLELKNGVELTIEGPVRFEMQSVDLMLLLSGRVVAKVPPQAVGFSIITPSAEVVDLGTEFGVEVEKNGSSQIHVIEGEVKARLKGGDFLHMRKQDARLFTVEQQVKIIASQPEKFLRSLPGKSNEQPHYLYWPCETADRLECRGSGIGGRHYEGTLKAWENASDPAYASGVVGTALSFDGVGAFVETDYAGINGSAPRTVAFWVKVPSDFQLENGYGMLSWGNFQPGEAWQISVNPNEKEGPVGRIRVGTVSAPVVGSTDLRDDQWHHVAVVMYGGDEADVATHILLYVDGELEQTTRKAVRMVRTNTSTQRSQALVFGKNIGFYHNKKNPDRFFKGLMDEIYIFDTALNQAQIRRLKKERKWSP